MQRLFHSRVFVCRFARTFSLLPRKVEIETVLQRRRAHKKHKKCVTIRSLSSFRDEIHLPDCTSPLTTEKRSVFQLAVKPFQVLFPIPLLNVRSIFLFVYFSDEGEKTKNKSRYKNSSGQQASTNNVSHLVSVRGGGERERERVEECSKECFK